jgi:predicted nucleic-acid-binding protein
VIGIDTNILVRYLAQDDPAQSRIATAIIEHRLNEDNPGFISIIAMAETVWVLDRAYRLSNRELADAVERILQTETFVIQNEQEVFLAMVAVKEGSGSFADALIAALGDAAGCAHTLTFDRQALRLRGFALP